ncbi:hypothetical protein ACFLST_01735 [Chloroflexota bacterium]
MMEISEGMLLAGLKAAAERLPFYPTRSGLGSDILTTNPAMETFEAPYTRERLVAMPALNADVGLIHVDSADSSGYGQILGDPYFDVLLAEGARKTFLCADKVASLAELKESGAHSIVILKIWVSGVVEAPYGAHPTACYPGYTSDVAHLNEYSAAAGDPGSFKSYLDKYVNVVENQSSYIEAIGGESKLAQLRTRGI